MKKLPTVGTSAATTAFCTEEIRGPGGSLFVDGNGKITRANGTLDAPKPNAFSLLSQGVENKAGRVGTHCPGATPTCIAGCYVDGLAKHASATYEVYGHNSQMIREILAGQNADEWALIFAGWIRHNVSSFRWHVSGDVFSAEYAQWIADVCREAPGVEFWIYTRSFAPEILGPLSEVSTLHGGNLALNLSADKDNYIEANAAAWEHSVVHRVDSQGEALSSDRHRLCFLTSDGVVPDSLGSYDVIFPDYALRGGTPEGQAWFAALQPWEKSTVCPVDYHGKAENRRCGPCDKCLS